MKFYHKIINHILILSLFFLSISLLHAKTVPSSFADLAEKLSPSVVNISTTQTITTTSNPFPFQFPPGSPFEDMFKEFYTPQERKSTSLGSGFIVDKKGLVVTNNHVVGDAEDIIVRVNDEELSNNLGLNEVAKLITGPVGSTVKITVRKKFLKTETTYSIFRKKDTGVVMMMY